MRIAAFALLLAVAASGCATPPPASETVLPQGSPAGFGESVAAGGVIVTPLALVEDSRCPQGVACVWAGRVRVTARIADGGRTRTSELTLGNGEPVGGGTLVLAEVTPSRFVDTPIAPAAYRFTFRLDATR